MSFRHRTADPSGATSVPAAATFVVAAQSTHCVVRRARIVVVHRPRVVSLGHSPQERQDHLIYRGAAFETVVESVSLHCA